LATIALMIPSAVSQADATDGAFTQQLRLGLAVLLMVAYGLGMLFSLKTHRELFAGAEHDAEEEAPWPIGLALGTLAGVTVLVALGPLGIALPRWPLWGGIGALALFNVYATWRSRRPGEERPGEAFAHMPVDVAVLAWLVAWSGGIGNPFSSMFLLLIAVSALALPLRWVLATGVACLLGYIMTAVFGRPVPHLHGGDGEHSAPVDVLRPDESLKSLLHSLRVRVDDAPAHGMQSRGLWCQSRRGDLDPFMAGGESPARYGNRRATRRSMAGSTSTPGRCSPSSNGHGQRATA